MDTSDSLCGDLRRPRRAGATARRRPPRRAGWGRSWSASSGTVAG